LTDSHQDALFDILKIGVKKGSAAQIPADIAKIESFYDMPDRLYLLENNVLLDIEFDSSNKPEDITRYMFYAALISSKYSAMSGHKIYYPVRTVVVYPGNVKLPTSIYTNTGSLRFTVEQISLNDVIDGEAFIADLKKRLDGDPKLVLPEDEVVKLVLASLGKVTGNRKEFAKNTVSLAQSLFKEDEQQRDLALVVASTHALLGRGTLSDLLGGGKKMNELANYLSGGDYMKVKAENDKIRSEREAEKTKVANIVLKMKLANFDLPTIRFYTGLSIEEIEQILN
jgi:hypothetical protein